MYYAAQRKLFIGKSSLFSTGNVPPKDFGDVASNRQGLVSGEAEKDTMCEVWDKPQSKHRVRSWERKSKRILSTGALAQLMGRLKTSPLHGLLRPAPFRLKLCRLLITYLSLFLKRLGE